MCVGRWREFNGFADQRRKGAGLLGRGIDWLVFKLTNAFGERDLAQGELF